jgi:hypothetical protein
VELVEVVDVAPTTAVELHEVLAGAIAAPEK